MQERAVCRLFQVVVRWTLAVGCCASAGHLHAQCALTRGVRAALLSLERLADQPGYAFRKAEIYLDSGCYTEARPWFVKARESVPQDPDDREQALNAINGSVEIIDAAAKFRAGRRNDAIADLKRILQTYGLLAVTPRAAVALAELIVSDPDPQVWQAVEDTLRELADEGWSMWRPKFLLVEHEISRTGAPAAIASLTSDLAHEIPTQRRIMLQVLLAHVLARAARMAEAAVLLSNIEDDVGKSSLDVDLRVFYLNLCTEVWRQRVQTGADPSAGARLRAFQNALNEARAQR